MVAAAIIAGGAAIGGAIISNNGTKTASTAATNAANATAATATQTNKDNNALALDFYNRNTNLLNPFITRGNQSGDALAAILAKGNPFMVNWDDFKDSPDYALRVKHGVDAINANQAAHSMLNSGKTLKATIDYGQEEGSREAQSWWARQNATTQGYLGLLDDQQRQGFGAASAVAGVGQNFTAGTTANNNVFLNAIANANNTKGDAIANASLAGASNVTNLLGNLAGAYGTYRGMSSFAPKKAG